MSRRVPLLVASLFALSLAACSSGGGGDPPAELSHDATLASLAASAGTLSPAFAADTSAYTLVVAAGTTTVTLTATPTNPGARWSFGGTEYAAGVATSPLPVPGSGASLTLTVRVTAADGTTTRDYVIVLTQAAAAPSTDTTLGALVVSAGVLTPAFASATTSYTLALPNGTASVTFTPTVGDPLATVTVDGVAVTSGSASAAVAAPAVGASTTITVRVTAEDGTTALDYVIVLTLEAAPSGDATLSSLAFSAGTLSHPFAAAAVTYDLSVPAGTSSITVTPTAADGGATITVDGAPVTSGGASADVAVPGAGATHDVTIVVTAADGVHTSTYTVHLGSFTIYLIGDSTMAYYDPATYPNQRGWGQMLSQFVVTGDATLSDNARNGRSSKSFYNDPANLWPAVRDALQPGDWVFIQFAHNDEKADGLPDPAGVGTAAWGEFHDYLVQYVDETRAHGGIPLLVTPVVRRNFSGVTLTAVAAHDLTGNGVAVGDANYVAAMKDVGSLLGVPVIDMTASTKALVELYGPTDSKSVIYIATDDTHLQPLGATLFAQLAAQELVQKGILATYLDPAGDLVVNPTSLAFGTVFLGAHQDKAAVVTGLSLSPAAGNVTVTAPAGFLVGSTATGTFGATLDLAYTGGRLSPTTFFVRFEPTAAQAYAADVTVAPPTGATKTIAVGGTGADVPVGGTESTAVYSLTADDTCTSTGLASCISETLSGVEVKNYAVPSATSTTWNPSQPASTLTQRLQIVGGSWPGDSGAVATRYAQFAVSSQSGTTWNIDSISLWAGGAGGSKMAYRVEYSTAADFATSTVLLESLANTNYAMVLQSFSTAITVNPGETLYVRVYPWYTAAATGKYLCLQTLTFHGTAQ